MKTEQVVKYTVYTVVVILSAIIISLIILSPPSLTENKSVYEGF